MSIIDDAHMPSTYLPGDPSRAGKWHFANSAVRLSAIKSDWESRRPVDPSADLAAGGGAPAGAPALPTGPNPWAATGAADQQTATADTAQAKQNISTMQGNLAQQGGAMKGDASAYPAMANAYGLGQQAAPAAKAGHLNTGGTDSSSRGFNPWSLTGESNSRG